MAYGRRTYRTTRRPIRRTTRAPVRRRAAATVIQKAVRRAKVTRFNRSVRRAIRPMIERKTKIFAIFSSNSGLSGEGIPGAGLNAPNNSPAGLKASNLLNQAYLYLQQGTASNQRVGNKVQNCRLTIRGFVKTNPFSASNNPMSVPYFVHVILYKKKVDPAGDVNELIKRPDNSVGPITYSTRDQLMPFNKNAYIMRCVKRFKLRPPYSLLQGDIDTSETSDNMDMILNGQQSNAPFCRFFSFSVPVAKTLLYDNQSTNAAANTPNNDWVTMAAYITRGDGADYQSGYMAAQIYADGIFTFTDG